MKARFLIFYIALFPGMQALAEDSLVDLVANDQYSQAMQLISAGADVNVSQPDGTTALMYAAYSGNADMAKALIDAGANPDASNIYGSSAILEAAIAGATDVLKVLLTGGADANWSNPEGETPLMNVARAGQLEAAELLLSHGAQVNAAEQWGGQTALLWAAAQSQPEMLALLIANGADVNARSKIRNWERTILNEPRPQILNRGGFTALHYAGREGCTECILILATAGANMDAHDPERVTPLNIALINQHYSTAAALIEAGADVDKWDLYGRSPLFNAIDLNTLPTGGRADIPSSDLTTGYDIAVMLLERGANPDMQLKLVPPLREAIYDRGSDKVLTTGATALMRAVKGGDLASTQLLLDHGAQPDLPNKEGQTPMMIVAGIGHTSSPTRGKFRTQQESIDAIRLLLDAGADINALSGDPVLPSGVAVVDYRRDKTPHPANEGEVVIHGQTALHGAAKQGWTEVARFLIENGAQQQVIDDAGTTPFDLAMGRYAPAYNDTPPLPFFDTAHYLQQECDSIDGCVIPDPINMEIDP
ncbi:MAG: hypothetical protein HOH14_11690 [Gammaproteobacteria bacterium]|jgi:uncharacterized protein|nr:hypothetical protein [Gammaproteobacteria bacterium]MBT6044139.1 hypothetical protein [Gammaproteobacteria bacterium]